MSLLAGMILLAFTVQPEPVRPCAKERCRALVIGISSFAPGWKQLPGTQDEVRLVREHLKASFTLEEAGSTDGKLTLAELRASITAFLEKAREDKVDALLYLATHGARNQRGSFLVASDTPPVSDGEFEQRALSIDDLGKSLERHAGPRVFLVINSCHSGGFLELALRQQQPQLLTMRSAEEERAHLEDLNNKLKSDAQLVLTAGTKDQEVPDENNPFHREFVKGLKGGADFDGDGFILGTELALYVQQQVRRSVPNDPVFVRITLGSPGDFVFPSPTTANRATRARANDEVLDRQRQELARTPGPRRFVDCLDCPVMLELSGAPAAIGRTEVTYGAWKACFRQGFCPWKDDQQGRASDGVPVGSISVSDAERFIEWLNKAKDRAASCGSYRLPRLEEWEAAAFSGPTQFPWGTELGSGLAVCARCGSPHDGKGPAVAGSLPAQGWGVHEAVGNLWEWVEGGRLVGGAFSTALEGNLKDASGKLKPSAVQDRFLRRPNVGLRVMCDLSEQRP